MKREAEAGCFHEVVTGKTELAFQCKDYTTRFHLICCFSNSLLFRFGVGRVYRAWCLEIKSYCSYSLNHNNEFGLTKVN